MISTEKPGTPAELAHHGVKGMKWGVRRAIAGTGKAYTQRQRGIASQELRVGSGGGTSKDKFDVHSKTSISEALMKGGLGGKSFKKAATGRAMTRLAHVRRVENGKLKTEDVLRLYGNLKLTDVHKGVKTALDERLAKA